MKVQFVLSICIFLILSVNAQDYKASQIPDSLKRDANAVKRYEELHVIIKGIDKAVVKHKYAITILNESGDDFATYTNDYTNLISLSDISGKLFDSDGKLVRSVRKKDISDMSATNDESLLTDRRVKRYSFYHKAYPYTVEFEDEQDYNGIFFLPAWHPVEDEKLGVQQSKMIVEAPAGYQLRFKQFSFPGQPVMQNEKNETYIWELQNYKPVVFESLQPDITDIIPMVFIAPSEFSIGGYKGNMRSWQDLGLFISNLNKKRDELPESIRTDIHRLTDQIKEKSDKIKALYQYMQQNTRYISIQLGIGSWQPFDAKFVAEKKYGDCKALSNYMVSLLKEAGIKANYVLITAGEGRKGLYEDFPAPYFNHAICCVPNGKDTLWLECTSQTQSAGFMGTFTGDRKALLIDEDGGHVVTTPSYKAEDNLQIRTIQAVVDAEGNITADVTTKASGNQQELMHSLLHNATKEERAKYLNRVLSLPTYNVDKSDYKEIPGLVPVITEELHIKASNYASVSGKRLFITPNLFNRSGTRFTKDAERKYPVRFTYAFRDEDTIRIQVPEGYMAEAMPRDQTINSEFGSFSIHFTVANNKIEVIRKQTRYRKEFPPSFYPDIAAYFDAVYRADRSRIVLVKNN